MTCSKRYLPAILINNVSCGTRFSVFILAVIVGNKVFVVHHFVNRETDAFCRLVGRTVCFFQLACISELFTVVTTSRRKVAFHQILVNRDRTFFTGINRACVGRCCTCAHSVVIRRSGGEGADAEGHYGAEDAGKETF